MDKIQGWEKGNHWKGDKTAVERSDHSRDPGQCHRGDLSPERGLEEQRVGARS